MSLTFACFFFFNDTATTEIYTLSLHDALPISEPRAAGRTNDGRRVHSLADGLPPYLRRRPGVRHEVGPGLDARLPRVPEARPCTPQASPQRAVIPQPLRVHRELRATSLAR